MLLPHSATAALTAALAAAVLVCAGCGQSNSVAARYARCVSKVAETPLPAREAFAKGVCEALQRDGELASGRPVISDTLNALLKKQPGLFDPLCVPVFTQTMPYAPAAARAYVAQQSPHDVATRICRAAAQNDVIRNDFELYQPNIAETLRAHPAATRPWVFYRLVWQFSPSGVYTRPQWFKGSWHAAVRIVAAHLVGTAPNDRYDYYTTKPKLVERIFENELAKTR